jgi:hypothetical protein
MPQVGYPPFFPPYDIFRGYIPPVPEQHSSAKRKHGPTDSSSPVRLSDDTDELGNSQLFPKIGDFLDQVKTWDGGIYAEGRNLEQLKKNLSDNDVLRIDELRGMSEESLRKVFGFTWGNAKFIRKAISKGITQVMKEIEEREPKRSRNA